MSDDKQGQDQLSALFSQRFKDRESAPTEAARRRRRHPRKRGRPVKGSSTQDNIVLSCCRNSPSGSTMRTMQWNAGFIS